MFDGVQDVCLAREPLGRFTWLVLKAGLLELGVVE